MKFLLVFFATLFLANIQPLQVQADLLRVNVIVSGSIITADDNSKNLVQSYLTRELRSLGDVEIDVDNPEFVLSVVVLQLRTKAGINTGYAISFVELSPYSIKTLDEYLVGAGLNPKDQNLTNLRTSINNIYQFRNHEIRTGSIADLKNICEEIIANFDAQTLAFSRKINKLLKKNKIISE